MSLEKEQSAFVLGLLGFLLSWIPVVGLVLSYCGIVKSREIARSTGLEKEPDFSKAGFVLSIIGFVSGIIVLAVCALVIFLIQTE